MGRPVVSVSIWPSEIRHGDHDSECGFPNGLAALHRLNWQPAARHLGAGRKMSCPISITFNHTGPIRSLNI